MRRREYTGVMHTEHPVTTGAMLVQINTNTPDKVESACGDSVPASYAYGRLSGSHLIEHSSHSSPAPMDMMHLLALGRELESLAGRAQNIQWAYADGKFRVLHVSDSTRSICDENSLKSHAEMERRKLLQNLVNTRKRVRRHLPIDVAEPVYIQTRLSESPARATPLSADLMERLWSVGGSRYLACRALGIRYKVPAGSAPYINTMFGWIYINKQDERHRSGKDVGAIASFRIARKAQSTLRYFQDDYIPQLRQQLRERDTVNPENVSLEAAVELLDEWINGFVKQTCVQCARISLYADHYTSTAATLLSSAGLESAKYVIDHRHTTLNHALSQLDISKLTDATLNAFLLDFGDRAPHDFELAEPRFCEDASLVRQSIQNTKDHENNTELSTALPETKKSRASVQRANDFIRLSSETKHYCLCELAHIRRVLLAIDRKLQLAGRIFQLTIDEVIELRDSSARHRLIQLADERFELAMSWKSLHVPPSLSIAELERLDTLTGTYPNAELPDSLGGMHIATRKEVTGPVRVITNLDQMKAFKRGEILVTKTIEPDWYSFLTQARGIITETGGALSHGAIFAREHNLPAIVSAHGITDALHNGDVIRMTLTGAVELVSQRRKLSDGPAHKSPAATIDKPSSDRNYQPGIYQLSNRKMFSYSKRIERRARKQQTTDRRAHPRFSEEGSQLEDRRIENRMGNVEKLRKTG